MHVTFLMGLWSLPSGSASSVSNSGLAYRFSTPDHRLSGGKSEGWARLLAAIASSVITLSIFVFGATDCISNHLRYFRFSLPKPSNSNIVAREPISSIEHPRTSFFSFGWPANTTESMPPLSRTTSISRLRPISVLLCRSGASSMNRAIGFCRFLIKSRSARSSLSG
jgi:hypothetical protein